MGWKERSIHVTPESDKGTGGWKSRSMSPNNRPPDEPPPTVGESALRGGAQGALMDWADEGEAALRTAGDVIQGNVEWNSPKERYGQHLKKSREAFKRAEQENPRVYGASQLAGGIGSTLALPGVGASAGLAKVAGAGLLQGAVTGAGASEAKDLEGVAKDAAISGAFGAGISGGAYGIGKGLKAGANAVKNSDMYKWLADKASKVGSKSASLLSGMSEEGLSRYKVAPDAVNNARAELGDDVLQQLEALKNKAVSGSHAAGDALPDKTIAAGSIQDQIDDLAGRAQGRFGKRQAAASKELDYWRSELNRATKNQHISLDDLNKLRKDLGVEVDLARKAGEIDTPKNQAKKALRNKMREALGKESDEFDQKMIGVADDFKTLTKAKKVFGNERTVDKAIKHAAGKNGARDAKILDDLGARSGGGSVLQEAKDYALQQAFKGSSAGGFTGRRSITGGLIGAGAEAFSQANNEGEIDPLRIAMAAGTGGAIGAASDRYAPQFTKAIMDSSREGAIGATRESVKRMIDAAKRRGPDAIRAVQFMVMKQFPQFQEMLEDK